MLRFVPLLAIFAACAATPTSPGGDVPTAPAPTIDVGAIDGSGDTADHSCDVVLRQLVRNSDGLGGYQTIDGDWVWSGTIEISTAAQAEGLVPAALYQSGSDPSWYVATTAPSDLAADPGFARYDVTLSGGNVPGPSMVDPGAVQVVPYLALPGGGRLFDHNRNQGATDNYVMASPDYAVWPDPTVCEPTGGPTHADLVFESDFTQHRDGVLEPGGDVSIVYSPSRLAQCETYENSEPAWDVTAHVLFEPGGQEQDASVRDAAANVAVPGDAQSVAVWFEATSAKGCDQWDSNYGANYVFPMMTPPQWVGDATNLFTRDTTVNPCDGGDSGGSTPAEDGFSFDTWVRQEALVTNLCFQVYQPGITDVQDPNLWQDLDVELQVQVTPTTWESIPVDFDRYVGNNARYKMSWRDLDPFRPNNCPSVPVTPTSDGMYVQAQLGYYVTVNGYQLRPEPGAWYEGTFVDYPSNPWRTANCN